MDKTELKLLMLEDIADDARLIERVLQKAELHFSIKRISTKQAFLAALDSFEPDIILSDYALPGFTGLEALLLLKEKNILIPFLLVTGALPETAAIEIVKAGFDDYILKDNLQRLPSALQNARAKKAAQRQTEELNELRKKFISIMSHQLRTPLTVVNWLMERLLSGEAGEVTKGQKEILHEAYDANQKLITRIGDLLTVIDIEEGRVAVKKQKTSLDSLWKSVAINWKKHCEVKGITCKYQHPPSSLKMVAIDPDKIRVVFEKLAENAVAYTPPQHKVTASLKKSGDMLLFEITDTGIGIPQAEQANIFTSFFRATNASVMLPDATGVGLAIAKYFVEQHGGTIGFTSKEGKGSTFWFKIPMS